MVVLLKIISKNIPSVCFVNLSKSIISKEAVMYPGYATDRMTSFTGIPPHVKKLSVVEGIIMGKSALYEGWCSLENDIRVE